MKIPKILQNSAIYSAISFLQKGISFFLLPLYTAYLTPSDYGVLNVITSVTSLLSLLFLVGLQGAGTRFYYKYKDDIEYGKRLWGSLTLFVIINSVVLGSLCIIFHKYLIDPLIGNISFYPYVFVGILYTIASPLYLFYQTYLQARQEGLTYGINSLLNFLVNIGLIIFFVVYLEMGVLGVLFANLLTAVLFFIYVIIAYIPKIKLNLKKDTLGPSLNYSLPLIPHLLAGWSTGMIDRLFLNGMKNESETGLYSVGSQFGSITHTVSAAINSAYVPWFYESYDRGDFERIRTVSIASIWGLALISLLISLFSPELLKLMVSPAFREVWTIIPLLAFAYVFQGVYFVYINTLFLNKTRVVFIVSFSGLVANVVLNLLFIPIFGYIGSAIACFLSFFMKSFVALLLSRRAVPELHFHHFKMFLIVFATFAITFLNYPLSSISSFISLGVKIMVMGFLFAALYWRYRALITDMVALLKKR